MRNLIALMLLIASVDLSASCQNGVGECPVVSVLGHRILNYAGDEFEFYIDQYDAWMDSRDWTSYEEYLDDYNEVQAVQSGAIAAGVEYVKDLAIAAEARPTIFKVSTNTIKLINYPQKTGISLCAT